MLSSNPRFVLLASAVSLFSVSSAIAQTGATPNPGPRIPTAGVRPTRPPRFEPGDFYFWSPNTAGDGVLHHVDGATGVRDEILVFASGTSTVAGSAGGVSNLSYDPARRRLIMGFSLAPGYPNPGAMLAIDASGGYTALNAFGYSHFAPTGDGRIFLAAHGLAVRVLDVDGTETILRNEMGDPLIAPSMTHLHYDATTGALFFASALHPTRRVECELERPEYVGCGAPVEERAVVHHARDAEGGGREDRDLAALELATPVDQVHVDSHATELQLRYPRARRERLKVLLDPAGRERGAEVGDRAGLSAFDERESCELYHASRRGWRAPLESIDRASGSHSDRSALVRGSRARAVAGPRLRSWREEGGAAVHAQERALGRVGGIDVRTPSVVELVVRVVAPFRHVAEDVVQAEGVRHEAPAGGWRREAVLPGLVCDAADAAAVS
jgi:hypothetical protein